MYWQLVRPALPSATFSAAVVLVLTFATDYLLSHSFKINDPYLADTLAAVLAFLIFLLRSYAIREEITKIEAYQATEYQKRVRVSNAIMSIQHAIEQCDHVADIPVIWAAAPPCGSSASSSRRLLASHPTQPSFTAPRQAPQR